MKIMYNTSQVMKMIKLITEPYGLVAEKIDYMMGHEDGIKEIFYNKRNRLQCSEMASLIYNNNEPVGFLNVVNQGIDNVLFIDGGITQIYRGKGYGKEALNILLESNLFDEYLIGETQNTNLLANASVSKIGSLVLANNNLNYYLLQRELVKQFMDSEEFTKLKNYVEKTKVKRLTR